MIAIKTEISDSIDTAPSEVEVEPTHPINEVLIYFFNESKKINFHRFKQRCAEGGGGC